MNSVTERVLERINYDIDELTAYRAQCLDNMCKVGEDLEKAKYNLAGEIDPIKICEKMQEVDEIHNMFEELRTMYNDAIADVEALTYHKKALIRMNMEGKPLN